jgi:hypothetical protein
VKTEEKQQPLSCDLCGLEADPDRFSIHVSDKVLHFCCEGCQGIYLILHFPELMEEKEKKKNG